MGADDYHTFEDLAAVQEERGGEPGAYDVRLPMDWEPPEVRDLLGPARLKTGAVLPPPGARDVLYVFDLSCWAHRFWATMQHACWRGWAGMLRRVLRERMPGRVAVCADLPFPTFRHELAPDLYKAARASKDASLLERLRWCREVTEDVFGVRVVAQRGFEADDLIASLVRAQVAAGGRAVIVGLDKDLLQLVDRARRVVMWDGKARVWGPHEVHARWGVWPCQLGDYLALAGDTADGVPGVRGVGPKGAAALLTRWGTLDAALVGSPVLRGKVRQDAARRARALVALAAPVLGFGLEELAP